MTCRGGRDTSERSGKEENERQLAMVQLATWWRYSNLAILVTLKKGNHPSEAYMRRGQRKPLYRKRESLEGPHEEAEIQHMALR